MSDTKQIKAIYVGAGRFILGVPARDLTAQEWDALPPETQELAMREKIYQIIQPKKVEQKNKE